MELSVENFVSVSRTRCILEIGMPVDISLCIQPSLGTVEQTCDFSR